VYIMPHAQYLTSDSEIFTQETTTRTLSNSIGLTSFGFSIKKLCLFYPENLFMTSFRTSQNPYLPQSVSLKL
jgi:hypothetical protein